MNDDHRPNDFENLEQPLKAAVQAVLTEPVPDDAVQRVRDRAQQLAAAALPPSRILGGAARRWKPSRTLLGALSAAAALAAVVVGVAVLDRSGRAFAQMIEKVKAANTVRYDSTGKIGQQPEQRGKGYVEGNRMRYEQFGGAWVTIVDVDRRQLANLDMTLKRYHLNRFEADMAQQIANPIERLQQLKSEDAKPMGEDVVNGRLTRVFRLDKVDVLGAFGNDEAIVWVDVETELPAKIVARDPDPKHPMEVRLENFVWYEPLDPQLFSMDVPEGFEIVENADNAPRESAEVTEVGAAEPPRPAFAGGILPYRVPAHIHWDSTGTMITALMRDPESTPPMQRRENELRQWDVPAGQLRWSQGVLGASSVAATADGKTLATVIGYEVQYRDAETGGVVRTWTANEMLSPLAFSPEGKTLAAGVTEWGRYGGRGGEMSGGVQFWNVEDGSLVRTIADDEPTTFIRYSPDGQSLATASNAGPVKLWNASTGELVRLLPGRIGDFAPNGQTIACASNRPRDDKNVGIVDLFNRADGALVQTLESEAGPAASWILCVTFSPDGRRLAATDWNGIVTIWDVVAGKRERTIADHQAGVLTAAFSPDGATLATGGEDQTLRLWSLAGIPIEPASQEP